MKAPNTRTAGELPRLQCAFLQRTTTSAASVGSVSLVTATSLSPPKSLSLLPPPALSHCLGRYLCHPPTTPNFSRIPNPLTQSIAAIPVSQRTCDQPPSRHGYPPRKHTKPINMHSCQHSSNLGIDPTTNSTHAYLRPYYSSNGLQLQREESSIILEPTPSLPVTSY